MIGHQVLTSELHLQVSGPGLPQLGVICHMGIALSLDPLFDQILQGRP